MTPLKKVLIFCLAPLLAGTALAAQGAPSAPQAELRTWQSQAGSEFSGRLKKVEGDTVVLTGQNGREITVSLAQLSESDRVYVRDSQRRQHAAILEFYRAGVFPDVDLPSSAKIEGVRHVVQRENFCVPASAEMVLRFHGFSYDQDYLARISSRDSARSAGTDFRALGQGLRNLGIDSVGIGLRSTTEGVSPTQNVINGIRTAIAQGFPTVISYETSSLGHAVVAVAYDDRRGSFWVLDPARRGSQERLDYRVLERLITGAQVIIPEPQNADAASGELQTEFLQKVSGFVRETKADLLPELVQKLGEERIPAQFRDANRFDLRSSQGQTRSYARQDGVEFVRMALQRGAIVVAPQNFDEGAGLILIYGTSGNEFRAVEYLPNGTFRRGEVRPLDFSLRWLWRDDNQYRLPLVEIQR